jgi:hypothetical protein
MSALIKVNSIDLVGTWNYSSINKDCSCKRSLQLPTESQINKKNIIRNNVVIGECNHGFHDECMHNKFVCEFCPTDSNIWKPIKTTNNVKYVMMK